MVRVNAKEQPELLRIVRAVSPSYRKHTLMVCFTDHVELTGTYWDGGSRSTYTAVCLATLQTSTASQFAPAEFGGPKKTPSCEIPEGFAIVETGTFCGKPSEAYVYMPERERQRLITQ